MVIITFQRVNRTFNIIFGSFIKSLTQADGSLPNLRQYQQNVPQHYFLLDTLVLRLQNVTRSIFYILNTIKITVIF